VLVALPLKDEDDLAAQANDAVYGLACGIWTSDYRAAWRLARRIEAGTVWVNTYKQFSISTPFGGMKQSGIGREKGRQGIAAFSRQKSVYLGLDAEPMAWTRCPAGDPTVNPPRLAPRTATTSGQGLDRRYLCA
jgi:betaine-aldehyde dehydrogenase